MRARAGSGWRANFAEPSVELRDPSMLRSSVWLLASVRLPLSQLLRELPRTLLRHPLLSPRDTRRTSSSWPRITSVMYRLWRTCSCPRLAENALRRSLCQLVMRLGDYLPSSTRVSIGGYGPPARPTQPMDGGSSAWTHHRQKVESRRAFHALCFLSCAPQSKALRRAS